MDNITNNKREIPKVTPLAKEFVTTIALDILGDVSIAANCAAVLATVYQTTKIDQSLSESKSRISKRNLTVPRLKLASAHKASNLVSIIVSSHNAGKCKMSYRLDS